MTNFIDMLDISACEDWLEDESNLLPNQLSNLPPNSTFTENGALSLSSTLDPLVDLFYKTIRDLDETTLRNYLFLSWNVDPLNTLKLIFFTRDIRGKGKGEKKLFYQGFRWLMDYHSEAVRKNAKHIPFYGCYKDWLELFLNTKYEKSMLKALSKQMVKDMKVVSEMLNTETNELLEPSEQHESTSLVWKWAPTEKTHYDKGNYKNTVSKLCKNLGMSKKEYRKTCSQMRNHLTIVESLMCDKKWETIDFSKVPSRAMNIYKKSYEKHQKERFEQYLNDVKKGKTTMNTGTLQPHEIVGQYFVNSYIEDEAIEIQWLSFVNDLKKKKLSFDQSIAVVDTSGSMSMDRGLPRKVAYSLGLLLSEFCTGPFHNKWIEFSSNAKYHTFTEGSLRDKLKSIKSIVDSTNLQSVFDLILNTYQTFDVPSSKQIKRVFIFTDAQWDEMVENGDKTHFEVIDQKYTNLGYTRPEIIFWNVRANTVDFPVHNNTPRTSLVSGFSSDLLQLFLSGEELNPKQLVMKALSDPRYDRLIL